MSDYDKDTYDETLRFLVLELVKSAGENEDLHQLLGHITGCRQCCGPSLERLQQRRRELLAANEYQKDKT